MSRYTTELRAICSFESGISSTNYKECIYLSIPKIFNFDFPIFSEDYRNVLCTKILKHFYMREIGLETYGAWKLCLDETLNRIMPYYNKFYNVAAKDIDFLTTESIRENRSENTNENKNENSTGNGTATSTGDNEGNSIDTVSDTPQGTIQNLKDGKYLSTAAASDSYNKTTASSSAQNTSATDSAKAKESTTENFIKGYRGFAPGDLVTKYYNSLVNIDQKIIDELEPLFMGLW